MLKKFRNSITDWVHAPELAIVFTVVFEEVNFLWCDCDFLLDVNNRTGSVKRRLGELLSKQDER